MGGDLIPAAIQLAREVRRGDAQHGPSALYKASSGRADVYRHAMREAGYVVPNSPPAISATSTAPAVGRAPAICDVCGYDFEADAPRRAVGDGHVGMAVERKDLTPDEIAAIEWCLGRKLA